MMFYSTKLYVWFIGFYSNVKNYFAFCFSCIESPQEMSYSPKISNKNFVFYCKDHMELLLLTVGIIYLVIRSYEYVNNCSICIS